MSDFVDHPSPCMPLTGGSGVIRVDLGPFGMPGRFERLVVATGEDGRCVVACLPFFTYEIQFGDLVSVRPPGSQFERVIKPSGLRTLRFAFSDHAAGQKSHEAIHKRLLESGLPHEWHGVGYAAVLLRSFDDQQIALACFATELRDGAVMWEVDPEAFPDDRGRHEAGRDD